MLAFSPYMNGAVTTHLHPSLSLNELALPHDVATSQNPWSNPDMGPRYKNFAGQSWYHENNKRLLELAGGIPSGTCVDLGSGTGSGTKLLLERTCPSQLILGIDSSPTFVTHATTSMGQEFPHVNRVIFVQGNAESFENYVNGPIGAVFAFNAIHLFQDFESLFKRVADRLEPEGLFAFNSGFSADAVDKRCALPWIRLIRALRKECETRGIWSTPERDTSMRCKTLPFEGFTALLRSAGFSHIQASIAEVEIPCDAVKDFLVMPGLAQDILPKHLEPKIREDVVAAAVGGLQLPSLTRRWLSISARK